MTTGAAANGWRGGSDLERGLARLYLTEAVGVQTLGQRLQVLRAPRRGLPMPQISDLT